MIKTCLNCGVEFEGVPQAKFHSNACRVAYSRREVAQPEEVAQGEVAQETVEVAHEGEVAQRVPSITLEEYVKQGRQLALAYSKEIGETNEAWRNPGTGEFVVDRRKSRIARAERYARWRYAGFISGEVASL